MLVALNFEKAGVPTTVSENNPLPVTLTYDATNGFSVSANSNNATPGVNLVAAQSGKTIKVANVFVSALTATQVTLIDTTGATVLGPIYVGANTPSSTPVSVNVTQSRGLRFKTSNATNVTVAVSGTIV